MSLYSKKMMEHFQSPRNSGEMAHPDAVGEAGNPTCGDIMRLYLKINPQTKIIEEVKFLTRGCGAAIATSSITTVLLKGKTLEEAARLTNKEVADALGGLPPIKMHCSVLAEDAIRSALRDYDHHGKSAPLPAKR